MNQDNTYSTFKVCQLEDIDTLISLIKMKGNFRLKDYIRIIRKVEKTDMPSRLKKKMRQHVLPLVIENNPKEIAEQQTKTISERLDDLKSTIKKFESEQNINDEKNNNENFWNKEYKASDFTIIKGDISILNYHLKSKRITTIKPKWLVGIEHVFRIAPEVRKKAKAHTNQFHFVPYTDLSYLLNEVKRKVDEKSREANEQYENNILEKVYEGWQDLFDTYLLLTEYHHDSVVKKILFKDIGIIMNNKDEDGFYLWDGLNGRYTNLPNIRIPISDVEIKDGQLNIKLINASFTYQNRDKFNTYSNSQELLYENQNKIISWAKFKNILVNEFGKKIIEKNEKSLSTKFNNDLNTITDKVRKIENITIDTYVSKRTFLKYTNIEYLYLYMDNNHNFIYPFMFEYDFRIIESYNINFSSEPFCYSDTAVKKIASIVSKIWNMDSSDYCNNSYNDYLYIGFTQNHKKPTNIELKNSIHSQESLRLVTKYYEFRLKTPFNIDSENNFITYFNEYANHRCSNNDYFRSYMIWSKEKDCSTIRLIPTDTKYTSYIFNVDTKRHSLEEASYIIWRYFSSFRLNKRLGFKPTEIFKAFGIYSVDKIINRPNIIYIS